MSAATPPTRAEQDLYRALGTRITQYRRRQGMSHQELAAVVGLARSSICNIETGRQRAPLHVYLRIAWGLGIPWGQLMPHAWRRGWGEAAQEAP